MTRIRTSWQICKALGLFAVCLADGHAADPGARSKADPGSEPILRDRDVVGFVGGATLVAIEQEGSLETLLSLALPARQLRFRSIAWEGDSVFARPREVNFPSIDQLLRQNGVTVVFAQFGATESFAGEAGAGAFREGYGRWLDQLLFRVPRTVVVTPVPFDSKPDPLPNLSIHNDALARYCAIARELALERHLPVVDLFNGFQAHIPSVSWTTDGRTLNSAGYERAGSVWARELGFALLAERAENPAFWRQPDVFRLRAAIVAKNRLWFDYWRPMNWAFLAGDRTDQPSSRDHRDPKIRWFPMEMEQFVPLIIEAETRVSSLAAQAETGQP